jgi:hypothetical protein
MLPAVRYDYYKTGLNRDVRSDSIIGLTLLSLPGAIVKLLKSPPLPNPSGVATTHVLTFQLAAARAVKATAERAPAYEAINPLKLWPAESGGWIRGDQKQVRTGLAGGGRRIRTLGPPPPVGLGSEFRGCRRKAPRFAILVCLTRRAEKAGLGPSRQGP